MVLMPRQQIKSGAASLFCFLLCYFSHAETLMYWELSQPTFCSPEQLHNFLPPKKKAQSHWTHLLCAFAGRWDAVCKLQSAEFQAMVEGGGLREDGEKKNHLQYSALKGYSLWFLHLEEIKEERLLKAKIIIIQNNSGCTEEPSKEVWTE